MHATAEMLRASEAAVVAGVSLRDINRVIDENILPEGFVSVTDGRRVLAGACAMIAFYFASARRLTAEERQAVISLIEPRLTRSLHMSWPALLREDWAVRDGFLSIDMRPFMEGVRRGLSDLIAAREMVESSPDILSGTPVFRGTRVGVHDVASCVAAGHSVERILEAWPSLDAEKVRLAAVHAAANPARGRPRSSSPPEGAVIVTDRRAPRARAAG